MWATAARAIPWNRVLKAIPWANLVDKITRSLPKAAHDTNTTPAHLSARLDLVEEDLRRLADVSKKMAQETSITVEGLSSAIEILAARVTWLLIVAGASLIISIIALVLVLRQ